MCKIIMLSILHNIIRSFNLGNCWNGKCLFLFVVVPSPSSIFKSCYFSSGILSSLASIPLALPLFPAASAAKFCEENEETTLDLADPKADPIFWLAEMKLCELEMEDQTEAVLLLAASRASPVFL